MRSRLHRSACVLSRSAPLRPQVCICRCISVRAKDGGHVKHARAPRGRSLAEGDLTDAAAQSTRIVSFVDALQASGPLVKQLFKNVLPIFPIISYL